ncbi:MAG TPA: sterol desaturase family protein [Chitinophagales bacterium]|nr:sterol desaturase family protein [Chitinophagales bacterium]
MEYLKRIWNFEIQPGDKFWANTKWILPWIWIVAIGFSFYTVMVIGVVPGVNTITISNLKEVIEKYFSSYQNSTLGFRKYLPYIFIGLAVITMMIRAGIIIHSYYLTKKKMGENNFNKFFTTFLLAFLISTSTLLLLSFVSMIIYYLGYNSDWTGNFIHSSIDTITALYASLAPYSLNISNYWLAIFILLLAASLPIYIVHYLSHKSRILWLLAHKAHHCPEFLFPIAAPSNNIAFLEVLLAIPGIIFFAVLSNMIYTEPLLFELAIWFTVKLSIEPFNHSSIHYDIANKKWIKRISMVFGDTGVYHLVHHSAYERDQNVNFGPCPFMIWDRLFGTFREPYDVLPPLGLTNQPKISWSPMKIVFSGFAQIRYEWKNNPSWRIRFKIIFGGVYYLPPITKEFLVLDNLTTDTLSE